MNEPKTMREHWEKMLEMMKRTCDLSVLDIYIRPLKPVAYAGNVLTVEAPTERLREYAQLRLDKRLVFALYMQTGREIEICYTVRGEEGAAC